MLIVHCILEPELLRIRFRRFYISAISSDLDICDKKTVGDVLTNGYRSTYLVGVQKLQMKFVTSARLFVFL